MENGEGQVSPLRSIYAEADAHGFVFSVVVVYRGQRSTEFYASLLSALSTVMATDGHHLVVHQ